MVKRNTQERKAELSIRRDRQRNRVATVATISRSKYIPAGVNKNV